MFPLEDRRLRWGTSAAWWAGRRSRWRWDSPPTLGTDCSTSDQRFIYRKVPPIKGQNLEGSEPMRVQQSASKWFDDKECGRREARDYNQQPEDPGQPPGGWQVGEAVDSGGGEKCCQVFKHSCLIAPTLNITIVFKPFRNIEVLSKFINE